MPFFVYAGPATRVTVKGRTFPRGIPTQVHDKLAAALAGRADFEEADGPIPDSAADQAPEDLRAALERASKAQLLELAAEREIDLDDLGRRPNHADLVEAIATAIEAQDAAADQAPEGS